MIPCNKQVLVLSELVIRPDSGIRPQETEDQNQFEMTLLSKGRISSPEDREGDARVCRRVGTKQKSGEKKYMMTLGYLTSQGLLFGSFLLRSILTGRGILLLPLSMIADSSQQGPL